MVKKLYGFDIAVFNKYDEDDFEMYAVVAPNKTMAKKLVIRYKERASLGATRKRKYDTQVEDGPYPLEDRNLKATIGVKEKVGG